MNDLLKKSIRGAVALGVVGALLAIGLPALANLLGPSIVGETVMTHAASMSVAWTSILFGGFGLLAPGIEKAYDLISTGGTAAALASDAASPDVASNVPHKGQGVVRQVHLHITPQQPQRDDHAQQVKARRLVVMLNNDQTIPH